MKKLVIGAALVVVATAVQAATYSWRASMDWASPDGSDDLVANAYVFDANAYAYATISAALAGGDTSVLGNALGNKALEGGAFTLVGTGLTDNGATPPYVSMYAILVANEGGQDYFYNVTYTDVKVTDAVVSGGAVFSMSTDVITGAVGGAGWTAAGGGAVPEPTSGLLMLLGVAGLALRRRRA